MTTGTDGETGFGSVGFAGGWIEPPIMELYGSRSIGIPFGGGSSAFD